jgi:hypothetical protein
MVLSFVFDAKQHITDSYIMLRCVFTQPLTILALISPILAHGVYLYSHL